MDKQATADKKLRFLLLDVQQKSDVSDWNICQHHDISVSTQSSYNPDYNYVTHKH